MKEEKWNQHHKFELFWRILKKTIQFFLYLQNVISVSAEWIA